MKDLTTFMLEEAASSAGEYTVVLAIIAVALVTSLTHVGQAIGNRINQVATLLNAS
jgi:Flp pilus assembly pilin Flp